MFTGTITGVDRAIAGLARTQTEVTAAAAAGVQLGLLQGEGIVKGKASGRPGPRAPTGDFRRGITSDMEISGTTINGQIGSNAAQALRLEYGFYGRDSLDRNYDQPPYPSFGPAVPEVRAALNARVRESVQAALGGVA